MTRILGNLAVAVVIALALMAGAAAAQNPQNLRAAVMDLKAAFGPQYPAADALLARLAAIESRLASAPAADKPALDAELAALAREIFTASPLLTAAPIVFASRRQYQEDHHNTETMFQTGEICTGKFKGPGALKAVDFAAGGKVRTILDAPDGVIRDPEVSFDGRRIIFSMRRDIRDDYHIYEVSADGTGLRQLTFGSGLSDIDPLYLPDGRIVFTSTREPKYCMCNRHIMGNLFRMDADGANIHQIGKNTLFEGHGCLMPDGRLLYDRWEYIDRNFGDAQGLWTCNPDGANHAVYWGNNTKCPGGVIDGQILPGIGSDQAVAVFSSCHDRPWGALAIIDRSLGVDGRAPVLRTWPADAIKYVMNGNLDTYKAVSPKYEDPYPLGDPAIGQGAGKYFLCSRQVGKGDEMGLALVDVFGNEVLLLAEAPGCFDPRPL
ncbi:MAG: hypothetical protein NT049_00395, partial [Planctomycetota bacterium]|nr:hypothetical protein [Planctomycetota bacterium]